MTLSKIQEDALKFLEIAGTHSACAMSMVMPYETHDLIKAFTAMLDEGLVEKLEPLHESGPYRWTLTSVGMAELTPEVAHEEPEE